MSEQEEPKIKPVIWKWDYGVYVPFCPYCDEPAYEKDRCFSCGKSYEWTDGEIEPTTVSCGEHTAIQATNNHISVLKKGALVSHICCNRKLTEEELTEVLFRIAGGLTKIEKRTDEH